jgi:hypothetical protein
MNITNETQVDGKAAKWLRERAGLSQKAFWGAYQVTQPGGCRYERGLFDIPTPVQRLIFAEHVVGLKINAATDESAAELVRLAARANTNN